MLQLSHTHDGLSSLPSLGEELYASSHAHVESVQSAHRDFGRILRVSGRWLIASDCVALCLAFALGGAVAWVLNTYGHRGSFQPLLSIATFKEAIIFAGLAGFALIWLDMRKHYSQRLPFWESISHIVAVTIAGFLVCGFIQFAAQSSFSRLWLGLSWVLFGLLVLAGRTLVRVWLQRRGCWDIPALLVGTGALSESFVNVLRRESGMGFVIVKQIPGRTLQQLTTAQQWSDLLKRTGASHLFVALEGSELEQQQAALKSLMRKRLPCSFVPPWMGLPFGTFSAHRFVMHDVLLLHDTNRLTLPLPCFLKRSFDILIAGFALLTLSPFMALVALLVRLDGGPAFFKQERVGKNGMHFWCYKFRSMCMEAGDVLQKHLANDSHAASEWQHFQKLRNDVRITKLGHFLRRTSIDELPQLINVLKGEMSLVGPRPIVPGQEYYYEDDFIYYENVRPGITGPWQVSGRNRLTFKERAMLECCYARNWTLWTDIVILLKTIPTLLRHDDAF